MILKEKSFLKTQEKILCNRYRIKILYVRTKALVEIWDIF